MRKARAAELQAEWKQRGDPPSACQHQIQELAPSDEGYVTTTNHCLECGEAIERRLRGVLAAIPQSSDRLIRYNGTASKPSCPANVSRPNEASDLFPPILPPQPGRRFSRKTGTQDVVDQPFNSSEKRLAWALLYWSSLINSRHSHSSICPPRLHALNESSLISRRDTAKRLFH
ncbi:MAG TPA: hypothetical protein VN657_11785 [Nitrospiraceae bacterium]|nr:hypothetical protein [Nitrospiraceae bacterium]